MRPGSMRRARGCGALPPPLSRRIASRRSAGRCTSPPHRLILGMSFSRRLRRFLDRRFDTETAAHFLDKQVHKRLPPHTGWLHVFGSLSLLLFINQTLTGILLLIYYRPTPEA